MNGESKKSGAKVAIAITSYTRIGRCNNHHGFKQNYNSDDKEFSTGFCTHFLFSLGGGGGGGFSTPGGPL